MTQVVPFRLWVICDPSLPSHPDVGVILFFLVFASPPPTPPPVSPADDPDARIEGTPSLPSSSARMQSSTWRRDLRRKSVSLSPQKRLLPTLLCMNIASSCCSRPLDPPLVALETRVRRSGNCAACKKIPSSRDFADCCCSRFPASGGKTRSRNSCREMHDSR